MLKNADTPVKAAQLAKECKVPKKNIHQVLYRMKAKLQVDDTGSATWCLRKGGTGEMVPTAPAQPSHGNLPTLGAVSTQHQQSWQWTSLDLGLGLNTGSAPRGCIISPHCASLPLLANGNRSGAALWGFERLRSKGQHIVGAQQSIITTESNDDNDGDDHRIKLTSH